MSDAAEIPLASPLLGAAEDEAVLRVLHSGRLSLGPLLGEFEERFAGWVGAPCASAVSSGTAGLHLALRAVGVSDGDEVITSPFSFVASANVIVYERARPVFVDIDPRTLTIDVDAAAAAVTERTSALLPVHIFGWPADVPALERLGLPIVEDACEALGARFADGVAVGARGHPAVFAFYANKQLTTGEGGMVTLADAAIKERSTASETRAARRTWTGSTTTGSASTTAYEIACAIGLAQLDRLDGMLASRARVAAPTTRRSPASRASSCSVQTLAGPCGAGSCTPSRCRTGSIAMRRSASCGRSACRASPTSRRST